MTNATTAIPLNLVKPSAPFEATVTENIDLTPTSGEDNRHVTFNIAGSGLVYVEGQSLALIPPGVDAAGKPHRLRLYSIASSRVGDDGTGTTVSLCVKRVVYPHPETGEEVRGVASNFINDLQVGDKARVAGPVGKHFVLPEDPMAPILMIATGTGVAPFRGFWRHRNLMPADARGRAICVFGVRSKADLLYGDEVAAAFTGDDKLGLALSREQQTADGRRMYVGDRLAAMGDDVWPLVLAGNLHVYICGLKGMEEGIEKAFTAIAAAHGEEWPARRAELVAKKQWRVETY